MLNLLAVASDVEAVNPWAALAYLVALQEHRRQVFQNPEGWLPWNYTDNLAPS